MGYKRGSAFSQILQELVTVGVSVSAEDRAAAALPAAVAGLAGGTLRGVGGLTGAAGVASPWAPSLSPSCPLASAEGQSRAM